MAKLSAGAKVAGARACRSVFRQRTVEFVRQQYEGTMKATQRRVISAILACISYLMVPPSDASTPFDLNAFRGQVVYLDFWASWCAPCRQSFPWMQAMKNTYARQGLTVIAVNLDQERADADRFLQRFHPDFDVRFDREGDLAERFKVSGMPSCVIIDRHGVLRHTHIGFRPADREAYEKELRELLAER
jgi:thiol-disulfide isomerase/thioredoxin